MDELLDFSNKTIVITGASRGIGAKMAEVFYKRHADLILCDQPKKHMELEKMKEILVPTEGQKINLYDVDISNVNSIESLVQKITEDGLFADVLINNAGVNSYLSPFEISEKQWDDVLDVNLKGTFFMTKAFVEAFIAEREGNVISIASQHGVVANYDRVHYCTSKAGIIQMTKALALEWSKFHVRVNCISPTFVQTKENYDLLYQASFKRNALSKIPLRNYAKTEDIAYAAIFLASPMARMITGHNLIVDGGWTIY